MTKNTHDEPSVTEIECGQDADIMIPVKKKSSKEDKEMGLHC